MMKKELFEKITKKKEFSQLPKKDVEKAFMQFDKEKYTDEEKVKLTRALLLKVFTFSLSKKLLSVKDKEPEWFLQKHVSTRDRFPYYKKIYNRIFRGLDKATVIDLGAGINGFSYDFFKKKIRYIGIEIIGQLVDLMNTYFKKQKLGAKAIHISLFKLDKIKQIIKKEKKPRVIFLFKVIDSLELLERDYTKKLLKEFVPLVDKVVLSYATKTMIKKQKIWAKRTWIKQFIYGNFRVVDDFELGGERYICFTEKQQSL